MEFGAREMMIALGALVALAIMLDVIRRIRNSRYEKIHMPRRKQPVFDDEEIDVFGSELPSGGARVVSYRDEADTEELGKTVKVRAEANKPRLFVSVKAPEQSSLNLGEAPVMGGGSQAKESDQLSISKTAPKTVPKDTKTSKKSEQVPVASVVVLHLMAKEGEFFQGEQLLDALLRQGLRYGSMRIFHRHEEEDGAGPVIYSVANSVNPGTFDLNNMAQLTTPGISLFFAMEDVADPAVGLDILLTSAKEIAIEVEGELKDESRSAFTRQTEDHYRQRVADFSRTQFSGIE
ncbi:MAG: cell division protein ZipA [Porticoccaceae bacterium]|nr:MAG: cell division protein ZipA [Porticoccaceae bacterium]